MPILLDLSIYRFPSAGGQISARFYSNFEKKIASFNLRFENDIAHIPAPLDFATATGTQTVIISKCVSIISDYFIQRNGSIPKRYKQFTLHKK